jgi:hypothetical protein
VALFSANVTKFVECRVTVEARNETHATEVARTPGEWLDESTGTTVGVQVEDVTREATGEVDCLDFTKYVMENRES